jgi:hypothetical protein
MIVDTRAVESVVAPSEPESAAHYSKWHDVSVVNTTPTSLELEQALVECLVVAPSIISIESKLADEDNRVVLS